MATIKKPAKKVASKKASPMMKAPSMGGSSPMMKMGGKIKKAQKGIELKEVTVSSKKAAPEVRNYKPGKGESSTYDYRKIDSVARKDKFYPNEYKINPDSTPRQNRQRIEGAMNSRTDLAEQMKTRLMKKNGGPVKKAKTGGSFPDLNKDGKITKADILKGRGVIAKSGKKMKTCKGGC